MEESTEARRAESCERCRELKQAYLDAIVAFYRASGMVQAAGSEGWRGVGKRLVLEYQRARREADAREFAIQDHIRRRHADVPARRHA